MTELSIWNETPFVRKLLKRRLWRNVFSVIGPRHIVVNIMDFKMCLDLTDKVGPSRVILKCGEFELYASELVKKWITPAMGVIDIGANIGYWSLLAGGLTKSPIYSFEPEPKNFSLFQKNASLNNFTNIKLIQKACGEKPDRLKLYKNPENYGDYRLYSNEEGWESTEVEVVVVDQEIGVVKDLGFIKIDVQGYELPVVKGMRKNLEQNKNMRLLSEFWPIGMQKAKQNPKEYLEFLESLGFRWQLIDGDTHSLKDMTHEQLFNYCEQKNEVDLWFSKTI